MQYSWSELIDRARLYVDDDHNDQSGWIKPARWLVLGQVEYEQLYGRWVQMGLIGPEPIDHTFTGPSATLANVLAIVGVAEVQGPDSYRILRDAQAAMGRKPIRGDHDGPATSWEAYGTGEELTVRVHPSDTRGEYMVRYVPTTGRRTDNPNEFVELPYRADERLVLGMARRALVKESSQSSAINALIREVEEGLNFEASQRNGGLVVRPVQSTPRRLFADDARFWRFYR